MDKDFLDQAMRWIIADGRQRSKGTGVTAINVVITDHPAYLGSRVVKRVCCRVSKYSMLHDQVVL